MTMTIHGFKEDFKEEEPEKEKEKEKVKEKEKEDEDFSDRETKEKEKAREKEVVTHEVMKTLFPKRKVLKLMRFILSRKFQN